MKGHDLIGRALMVEGASRYILTYNIIPFRNHRPHSSKSLHR